MTDESTALVDLESLDRFLGEQVSWATGELTVEKHVAGFSNETFFVTKGEHRWVMRRPPRGPLLPTAHDVLREHRFISALQGKARVPKTIVACEDIEVIGAPFYLMERKDGHVVRAELPPEFDTPEHRWRMGEEVIDSLVELHAVDWEKTGLRGRPDGYLERQLKRWKSQWDATQPRTRPLPRLDEATAWFEENMPDDGGTTVVHGDYKLDNVMFAPDEPRVIALFDWEMATIGDPLADLGWLLSYWCDEGLPDDPEAVAALTTQPGFPNSDEMVALYEQKSGRSMQNFTFYQAFAVYKLAIILEGLYMHYLESTAANPDAAMFEVRVPALVERVHRIIGGGR